MRRVQTFILAALFTFALTLPAAAHRVNTFVFVDGAEIHVECGFNRGAPVKGGRVEVFDDESGALLLSGNTDDQGRFHFPVPKAAREAGHGLRIRVNAGEGHQNEWLLSAAALAGKFAAAPAPAPTAASPKASAGREAPPAENTSGLSAQELEGLINAALERKLAPIREMLAEAYTAGPSWREIVGGIGWLVGLAGLIAYFKGRRPSV